MKEAGIPGRRADRVVATLVALVTLLVFSGCLRGGFLNWDDDTNILANPSFRGLGWANLRWMFTALLGGHYQPLVWLSFAADYLVWGLNPFGYHLTNILLHAANAALVYALASWFLRRSAAPGGMSPRFLAGLAALLFAVHPLRAESVAWVTERKDVLSGFFCLWAVYAYLRRHGDGGASAKRWQPVCWGAFVMALLSKSMVMTLPAVFIILDFYPLRRLPGEAGRWFGAGCRRIWLEKLPFLIPALLVALAEYAGERRLGAVFPESASAHCARAFFGLTFYLWKTIWPAHLCPLYELPVPFDAFSRPFLASAAAVGCVVAGLLMSYRRWPAAAAAWACYAVTLAPVLGLVSFGSQLVADRYSYLACLPWPIMAASGFDWAWRRAKAWGRGLLCWGAVIAVAGLAGSTWRQVKPWHDSETLWEYTISLRPRTSLAHNNLGMVLAGQGRVEEAVAHYREALRIKPDNEEAHNNLGAALSGQGRAAEAIAHYREALRLKPDAVEAHNNLGLALAGQGQADEAIAQYREALRLNPDMAVAHDNLGNALLGQGRAEEAAAQYREALRIKPDYAEAHNSWGNVLFGQGRPEEAVAQYREALRLKPDYLEAHYNLGLALARQGRMDDAALEFEAALRINPGLEPARRNLAALRRLGRGP